MVGVGMACLRAEIGRVSRDLQDSALPVCGVGTVGYHRPSTVSRTSVSIDVTCRVGMREAEWLNAKPKLRVKVEVCCFWRRLVDEDPI